MVNRIIRFPNFFDRLKRKLGPRLVSCQISDRWLEFPEKGSGHYREGEFLTVSVMTWGKDEKPRKLCELILTREELMAATAAVKKS